MRNLKAAIELPIIIFLLLASLFTATSVSNLNKKFNTRNYAQMAPTPTPAWYEIKPIVYMTTLEDICAAKGHGWSCSSQCDYNGLKYAGKGTVASLNGSTNIDTKVTCVSFFMQSEFYRYTDAFACCRYTVPVPTSTPTPTPTITLTPTPTGNQTPFIISTGQSCQTACAANGGCLNVSSQYRANYSYKNSVQNQTCFNNINSSCNDVLVSQTGWTCAGNTAEWSYCECKGLTATLTPTPTATRTPTPKPTVTPTPFNSPTPTPTSTPTPGNTPTPTPTSSCPPINPTNPVLILNFDQTSGNTVTDSSGYGNNGTISGPTNWASGANCHSGNCLNLQKAGGVPNYIEIQDKCSLRLADMTLSAWVRRYNYDDNYQVIFEKYPNYEAYFTNGGYYWFNFELGFGQGTTSHPRDYAWASWYYMMPDWHYYAMTYNNSTGEIKFYFDGVLTNTKTTAYRNPWLCAANCNSLFIGGSRFYSDPTGDLYSFIDQVKIWPRVVSDCEIKTEAGITCTNSAQTMPKTNSITVPNTNSITVSIAPKKTNYFMFATYHTQFSWTNPSSMNGIANFRIKRTPRFANSQSAITISTGAAGAARIYTDANIMRSGTPYIYNFCVVQTNGQEVCSSNINLTSGININMSQTRIITYSTSVSDKIAPTPGFWEKLRRNLGR